jgi:hypothetical protein
MGNVNLQLPFAMAPQAIFHARTTDHERSYEAGLRALDGRHYERALEAFSQAAMTTGSRTDGALFWKACAARSVWIYDVDRGIRTRFSSVSNAKYLGMVWSAESRRLAVALQRDGGYEV